MSPGVRVPYFSIWSGATPTASSPVTGGSRVRQTFFSIVSGQILAAKFWRDISDNANHLAYIVKRGSPGNRQLLRAAPFVRNAAGTGPAGWQTVYFEHLPILANEYYDLIVEWTGGQRFYNAGALATTRFVSGDLVVPVDNDTDPFGITYRNGAQQTTLSLNVTGADGANLEAIDINFLPD